MVKLRGLPLLSVKQGDRVGTLAFVCSGSSWPHTLPASGFLGRHPPCPCCLSWALQPWRGRQQQQGAPSQGHRTALGGTPAENAGVQGCAEAFAADSSVAPLTSILYPGGRKVLKPRIRSLCPRNSSDTQRITPGVLMLQGASQLQVHCWWQCGSQKPHV